VTVHKSQGSEFPVVVMPLLTQHFVMLERNLVYTGMTRAKRLLVMAGSHRALQIAVGKSQSRRRWTRLCQRLRAVGEGQLPTSPA
jgi:exodeoxyribonuclease V alpha subunit